MMAPTGPYSMPSASARRNDYSQWSIEELWQLASQLRVAGARNKSRRELLDLFAPSPAERAASVLKD